MIVFDHCHTPKRMSFWCASQWLRPHHLKTSKKSGSPKCIIIALVYLAWLLEHRLICETILVLRKSWPDKDNDPLALMLESDLHGNWVPSSMLNAQRWRKRDWRTCLMKPLLLLSSPRSRKSPKSAPYCKRSWTKDNLPTSLSLCRGYYIYTHTSFFVTRMMTDRPMYSIKI